MSSTPDQHIIDRLVAQMDERPSEAKAQTNGGAVAVEIPDEKVIEKARAEKNGKFDRLWHGDLADYDGDDSRADDGFVHKLWSYTQDEEQIRRIHAASGLHRPEKSGKRRDYLQRSIERARENVGWLYPWPDGANLQVGSEIHSFVPNVEVANERKLAFRTAREITEATPSEVEWITRPWFACGCITEVDGKIKAAGKTTWVSHAIRQALDGRAFMGEPTTKTKVVILTEQTPTSFRKVLERAGLEDRDDLVVLHWHDTAGFEWPEVAQAATAKALEIGARLLIVDTLGQFAGIKGDGENNAGAAQEAMKPLQEAAAQGLAVGFTRHERKGGGEVGESGRGSSAFGGAVDIILSIRRAEGNIRPTVRIIEALSRFDETPDKVVIELTENGYRNLGDATAFAEKEAASAIVEVLPTKAEHAIKTDDLLDKLKEQNIKRTVAVVALPKLVEAGTIERLGEGKKGNPYRYYKPLTEDLPGDQGSPDPVDQIHSFATPTYIRTNEKAVESSQCHHGTPAGEVCDRCDLEKVLGPDPGEVSESNERLIWEVP